MMNETECTDLDGMTAEQILKERLCNCSDVAGLIERAIAIGSHLMRSQHNDCLITHYATICAVQEIFKGFCIMHDRAHGSSLKDAVEETEAIGSNVNMLVLHLRDQMIDAAQKILEQGRIVN